MRPPSHSQHIQLQSASLVSLRTIRLISTYAPVKCTLSSEKTVQVRAPWPPCCAVSTNQTADTCCATDNQFRCHRRAQVCNTESRWCTSTSALSIVSRSQRTSFSAAAIFLSLSTASPSTNASRKLLSLMVCPSIHQQSLVIFPLVNVSALKS